jgi:hypothetical protein
MNIPNKNGAITAPVEDLPLDAIRNLIELANANTQRAQAASHRSIQKVFQELANTVNMFRQSGIPVDLNAPEFYQPLSELGLSVTDRPARRNTSKGPHSKFSHEEIAAQKQVIIDRLMATNGKPIKLAQLFEGLTIPGSNRNTFIARVQMPEGKRLTKVKLGHYQLVSDPA